MSETPELLLRPIGHVTKGRRGQDQDDRWEEAEAEIQVDPSWAEALDGIEGFSHIWVLWWPDRHDQPPERRRIHPERREDMPLVGIFATRSPSRPNPIAITAVRLLGRRGARLRVRGLDAYEGTPILDLKPYLRRGDLLPDATTPDWLRRLWRSHDGQEAPT
jgi:tRNA-Thr(GGU) m(6)t(6)A37 methyltransferase TsaA